MTYFESLSPKARVFARGFIDYMLVHTKDPAQGVALRKAQDAGRKAIENEDGTISIPYISKLTVMLENQGLIIKVRRGKSFAVVEGAPSVWSSFVALIESGYGSSLEEAIPLEVIQERSEILDYMKDNGAVIIASEFPLPKAQYNLLIEKFREGKYDMIFIDANQTGFVADSKSNMRRIQAIN